MAHGKKRMDVTLRGQTRDPNTLRVEYLEQQLEMRFSNNH